MARPRTLVDTDRGGGEKEVDGVGEDKANSHAEKKKEESMITVLWKRLDEYSSLNLAVPPHHLPKTRSNIS